MESPSHCLPSHCLIVEDHPDAQRWLASAVEAAFPEVECHLAATLAEARGHTSQTFDLALLDIGLPDGNGLDLVEGLVDAGAQVIISSVYEDDAHLLQALKNGASGYLLKDHPKEELVELLNGIIVHGRPPLSPQIARKVLKFFSEREPEAETTTDPESNLTTRERDVLTLLAKGYTTRNVAELLDLSPHTVAGYAKTIYRKLNVTRRAEATLEANRLGLVDARER